MHHDWETTTIAGGFEGLVFNVINISQEKHQKYDAYDWMEEV